MKRILLLIVLLAMILLQVQAQRPEGNPFARLGYHADAYVFGEDKEFHDQEELVEIGDVLFNTRTNKVVGFVEKGDSLIELKPELQSMSIDPLCEKYYSISPYAYCMNNPVRYTDPGGDSVRVYTETQATGHTWMSVGEGNNMVVYSYGRYNGTYKGADGSSNSLSNGSGVLLRLTGDEAKAYNEEKIASGMSAFVMKDVADETMANVMDGMFNSSVKTPDKGKYKDSNSAHVIDEYNLASNNCTTVVSDALNNSGSKALKSNVLQQTSSFGTYTTTTIVNRFILPISMQNYLIKNSKVGGVIYRTR